MRKIITILLIASVIALFVVPESLIGDYKGLLKIKYFLRDTAVKVKNIVFSFAKTGEKPKELDVLERQAKQKAEEAAKNAMKEAVKGAIKGL